MANISAFVLAKNEEQNIGKCLRTLAALGLPVTLLDSGSTDRTLEIARGFPNCVIEAYDFRGHAAAYNEITKNRTSREDFAMVLDADMEVTPYLLEEVQEFIRKGQKDVLKAPVQMYIEGRPLRFGSLYPPKPFVFRGGKEYFYAAGHSDRLLPRVAFAITRNKLIHNDLKPYEQYLLTQVRYGHNLWKHYQEEAVNFKDRLRVHFVGSGFLMAAFSYFVKGGILAGRVGLAYAIDRLIAGLVQYRVALAYKLKTPDKEAR